MITNYPATGVAGAITGTHTSAEGSGLPQKSLDSILLFALRRTQAALLADFSIRFDDLNLRPIQLGALLLIRNNPGSRQSDIAEALGIQRPNFVTMMDELDSRGLTRRTTSTTDRRSYSLVLTPEGEAVVQKSMSLLAEQEATVAGTLGRGDRDRLVECLKKIEEVLSRTGSPPASDRE